MSTPSSIHRDKLYKEIWQEPATKVAARYGISDSMLARICKKLNVPRPGLGHWSKVAHKHKVCIPKLPALKQGQKESWKLNRTIVAAQRITQQVEEKTKGTPVDEPVRHMLSAELKAHGAVRDTRLALKKQKPDDMGRVRPRWRWRHLDITVSPDLLDRSLIFINRFLHLCQHMGMEVCCPVEKNPGRDRNPYSRLEEKSGVISLRQGDHELAFSLRESYIRHEKPENKYKWFDRYDYQASGKLEFKLDARWSIQGQTLWKDGKIKKIEQSVLIAAQQAKNYFTNQVEREKRWKLEEERRIKEEQYRLFMDKFRKRLNKQRKLEEHTFREVVSQASDWSQADQLRRFIRVCEDRLETLRGQDAAVTDEDLLKLRWMKIRVEMLDPFSLMERPWNIITQSVVEGREPEDHVE